MSTLGGLVLLAAGGCVIPRVFGEAFRPAVPVAAILVLGTGLRNLARTLQVAMQGVGRPGAVFASEWAGLGALLAVASWLVPRLGLTGAAWSIVAASGVGALVAAERLWNWARREVPGRGRAR